MSSGVSVRDEVKLTYSDIKKNRKFRYAIVAMTDDLKEMGVESTGDPSASYEEFVEKLREVEEKKQCRYAIYDAEYRTKVSQTQKNKLVLFMWSPDTATTKQKMLYSSSVQALKRALGDGIASIVQANDMSDLEWEVVLEQISRLDRN